MDLEEIGNNCLALNVHCFARKYINSIDNRIRYRKENIQFFIKFLI